MTIKYERLYRQPTTLNFILWETDGIDINATASCVLGDVVLIKDDGTSANSTNLFSAHSSGMGHRIVITSAEASARRILIKISDRSATKEWLDEFLIIETYGNEKSQHNRRQSGITLETIITAVSGNAEFTILNAPNDNNTLLNCVAMIFDESAETGTPDRSFRNVTAYNGSTGVVNLASNTDFTIAVGDRVVFLPTADIASADDIASAVWDVVRTNHTTAGTYGEGVLVESLNASAQAQVSAVTDNTLVNRQVLVQNDLPTNFGGMAITGAGEVTIGTNNDKTGYALTTAAYVSAADVALRYDWTEILASAADRSTLNALRFLRNRWGISGSALTVYKENDTSAAWTSDLSVVASANTIIDSNPA